jgi:hypothetical protein
VSALAIVDSLGKAGDCSLRASAVMGFKCPDKGILTKPIFIANPCFSFACAAAQHGSDNNSRLKSSDELVSCYQDPAERVLFHDVEMKGRIREEDVGFRNQLRHQLTRLCVMTEADTLARPEGHQVFSFLPDLVF